MIINLAGNRLAVGMVRIDGRVYGYDVIKSNFQKDAPRCFISYNDGRPFISDEVPSDYRSPMVIHEIAEETRYNGKIGRCLMALGVELAHVDGDFSTYVLFRKRVFRELIRYLEIHNDPRALLQEVRGSLEHLESL